MRKKNKALFMGLVLFVLGGLTLFIERITDTGFSGMIGRLYCGVTYMQVSGQPGDGMCGFNMDMVVGMASFLLIVAGLLLLLIGGVKAIIKRMRK
jgi:hypothetical protein